MDKQCNKCQEVKDENEYHSSPKNKGGRKPICKSCISTSNKKRYVYKPRPPRSGYDRDYYENNKDKMNETSRQWYQAHKDDPEFRAKCSSKYKDYIGKHPERGLLRQAKSRAKENGLEFNLTEEDIIIPSLCPILQAPMERNTPYAPSVDKVNPTKGYTKDNIQIISKKANTMKSNATKEELRLFGVWTLTL